MTTPRAPYSLEPTSFPFPALAHGASRAPLGGPRETLMACFVFARLAEDAILNGTLYTDEQRQARAQGARQWLGALAVPASAKGHLMRLCDATMAVDRKAMRESIEGVISVTADQLDHGASSELQRLAQAVAG